MKKMVFMVMVLIMAVAIPTFAAKLPKRIGYTNNYATHEFYKNVIKGMRKRADELHISLEVVDAHLDVAKQVSQIEDFITKRVDALIVTPVNNQGVVNALRKVKRAGLPIVCESVRSRGMDAFVGICDYDLGYAAGVKVGKIVNAEFHGKARIMNVGLPLLRSTVLRSKGFVNGVKSVTRDTKLVHSLDGGGNPDRSLEVSQSALVKDSNINIIFGINNASSLGGLQAYRIAGLDEDNLVVASIGAEGIAFLKEMNKKGAYRVEAAMFPEIIGYKAVQAAVDLYQGKSLPKHVVTPTTVITQDTVGDYYTLHRNTRTIHWDNIKKIPTKSSCEVKGQ